MRVSMNRWLAVAAAVAMILGLAQQATSSASGRATSAAEPAKAASEPTVEATGAKPNDQTPSAEAAWGQAVEGVQVRLRAKQSKWNEGTAVRLWADVRNQGKRNLLLWQRCGELEVDGQWYRRPMMGGLGPGPAPFPPGRRHGSIAVHVDQLWELPVPENLRAPWATGPEGPKLAPGKHTIRVALRAMAAKNAPGKPVRAVSNPVELEIVAKSDEKAHATPQDNAGATSAEPTAEAGGATPDEQTPSAEAAWGQAVEGVQVRLRAKQSNWKQGTVPRLWADVCNQGKRNLSVRARDYGCELEVDGQWYSRPPVTHFGIILLRPLLPGHRYDDIAVDLHPSWQLTASRFARAPWKTGPDRLELTPGKHTIRVAFTAKAAENAPGGPLKAVSNPVEIEIVAKGDEKVDATQQAKGSATAAEPKLDGKEILDKLKSIDAVYAASFTASGKRLGWPRRKWKFTMHRGRIALEEEVVEIPGPTATTKKSYGPTQLGRFIAMRDTFYVGPTAQAKYAWVGRIPRYGPLDPWPENDPGPATNGSLKVDDPDAPTYTLHIQRTLLCLGRGYSRYITKIRDVSPQEDGRLRVTADGLDGSLRPGAKWELVIDPDAEYMVRSAEVVAGRNRRRSYTNSGLTRHGSHCVPEKGECKGAFISTSFEFQSASFEADVEFLRRAKATMQPPYLIHTDVSDQRRTPELRIQYDAGKLSPKRGKPDFDLDWEKEAVFDMKEVEPRSEPKLRALWRGPLTAIARKGEIKIHGRQYTALLAQLGTTTGSFDRPETFLLLTAADDPNHYIQSYEKHLGSIRTVDGKYYKISATPTGDKLTVTPCGDNVGILRVGAGDRDVEKRHVTGGVLVSKEGLVPLGTSRYPVPAEDPGQRRIPVGDYALDYLRLGFGNVGLTLRPSGSPAYNIKIRKDKPFTLNFSAKGNLLLTSPSTTQTFKPGSSVPLVAKIVDPELNLMVNVWDGKGSHDPTVVISDSSGKQVAEGKMPFC